jgi:ribose-phosphate pyrophosphokinase
MVRAARARRESGAKNAYALAAHGLFTGDAASALLHSDLAKTFVTDTVPPFRLEKELLGDCVEIVSAAPLFAEAIRALHEGNSINALLEGRD